MKFSRLALLFAFSLDLTRADNTTQNTICHELVLKLPDQVFFPDAPVYNASISSYPFIQLRLRPNCIVRPKSAENVSVALGVLEKSNNTRFAVKGGGHNANAGFNNIDNGVTIDMQSMKAVEVARGDQVVRVEAGALSQDAYNAAEKRNLTVLAGRIGVVGTAGFLTGGGISFFSPQFGWACDSILNFKIVLASGDIVNANATSRQDLFAALKGGQNNFGLVTRFDLKAYPATRIWGGRIVYAPAAATDFLTAFTNLKTAATTDKYVAGWATIQIQPLRSDVQPSRDLCAELTFQALPSPPKNGSSPNSLGFAPNERTDDMVFLQIVFTFDGVQATESFNKGLKELIAAIEQLTYAEGVYHPYKYLNFAAGFQDPIGGYGAEQKMKLKQVARKYDPTGMFQRQVPGGFKLF
ncbi:hypothetical protein SNOG_08827 [Parastagonospora nodorum SN15]|uniref:FAD-binding PCMH-type domain-containing protein n=1 Tax=Phaeosphaeria nodorum (strain SN15 / ATCC MYA-4574 / FGSC 10173) TaxID=321614 RepID=Q0UHD7_PHANO|nr:hypothetical protein SNOG_08827 [Parastagonospora nodorum SN15]EAT83995.2 hypothetical protein SNOG_08827 [Parastagonospora nodorum SN15]